MIALEIVLLSAAIPLALFYFGFGVTRLLFGGAWHPLRYLLSPFVGMALLVVWDYAALFIGLNLTQATWVVAAAATLVNLFVIRPHFAAARALGVHALLRDAVPREHLIVLLLAGVATAAAVAPLLRYGYPTIIGENWDYEFYLPLADLLQNMPTTALAQAPANPLLDTILSRHILPLPMGFTYLQSTLDVLTGREALDSFAILLAVLRGMGVVAAYIFMRATLKMSARVALASAAVLALNGLLLWFTYWNFGLHLASLALLPLALTFGIYAIREPFSSRRDARRALLGASLFLAALNVTYHPALVAALLPLGAMGLYCLLDLTDRRAVVGRGAALVGLTLLFSFPTLGHIDDFIREYYGRAPLAIGLREFVPLADGYGFSLRILDLAVGHTIPTPWLYEPIAHLWDWTATAFTLAAVLLSLFALWQLRRDSARRATWYLVVGASVFYIALFRLPFLRPYPYGFLKSLSLVSYILIAVAVQGAAYAVVWLGASRAERSARQKQAALAGRIALGGGLALAVAVIGITFALALEQYFKPEPAFFNADALTVRAAAARVPADATIFLTDRPEVQQIPMGLAAYALRGHPLRGKVRTGYGKLKNARSTAVYDYALLARGENPQARGYQDKALWENERFALYARQPGVLAQQTLDAAILSPAGISRLLNADDRSAKQDDITVRLALATFQAQSAEITVGEYHETLALAPGLTIHDIDGVPGGKPIEISITRAADNAALIPTAEQGGELRAQTEFDADAGAALYVPWLQLHTSGGDRLASDLQDTLLVQCLRGRPKTLTVECQVANPAQVALEWRWVIRGKASGENKEAVIAQGSVTAEPQARLGLDMRRDGTEGRLAVDDAPAVTFPIQPFADGEYRTTLEAYRGEVLVGRLDLAGFTVAHGGNRIQWTGTPDAGLLRIQP